MTKAHWTASASFLASSAADDVSDEGGGIDLSKLSQLLSTSSSSQASAIAQDPLLDITA